MNTYSGVCWSGPFVTGSAAKRQVQQMVGTLLGLARPPESDHTADALAVAICHAGQAHTAAAVRAQERSPVGVT